MFNAKTGIPILYQYLNCQGTITTPPNTYEQTRLYQYLNCQGTITQRDDSNRQQELYQYLNCQGTKTMVLAFKSKLKLYQYLNCQGTITIQVVWIDTTRLYQYLNCQGTITQGDIIDFSMTVVVIWQCKAAAPPYVRASGLSYFILTDALPLNTTKTV